MPPPTCLRFRNHRRRANENTLYVVWIGILCFWGCVMMLAVVIVANTSNDDSVVVSEFGSLHNDNMVAQHLESNQRDAVYRRFLWRAPTDHLSNDDDDNILQSFPALSVVQAWKRQHSVQVLRREFMSSSLHKAQHEQERLLEGRKYLVATYSCPKQAGNILLDFVSAFLVAIVTNRTLIVHYGSIPVLNRHPELRGQDGSSSMNDMNDIRKILSDSEMWMQQRGENLEAECREILHTDSWVPMMTTVPHANHNNRSNNQTATTAAATDPLSSWWHEKLRQLQSNNDHNFGVRRMVGTGDKPPADWPERLGRGEQLPELTPQKHGEKGPDIVLANRVWGLTGEPMEIWRGLLPLDRIQVQEYLRQSFPLPDGGGGSSEFNATTANRLVHPHGTGFLYGLLFHELFRWAPHFARTARRQLHHDWGRRRNHLAVALHSRHEQVTDLGENITRERKCFDDVAEYLRQEPRQRHRRLPWWHPARLLSVPPRPCVAYVASDRPQTLTNIDSYLQKGQPGMESLYQDRTWSPWTMNVEPVCRMVEAKKPAPSTTVASTPSNATNLLDHYLNHTLTEHGPFAGAGMFYDLIVLGTQAHDWVIGSTRSSSALFAVFVEYHHRIRNWVYHDDPDMITAMQSVEQGPKTTRRQRVFVRFGTCDQFIKPRLPRKHQRKQLPLFSLFVVIAGLFATTIFCQKRLPASCWPRF